jgi:hypothetical protein
MVIEKGSKWLFLQFLEQLFASLALYQVNRLRTERNLNPCRVK